MSNEPTPESTASPTLQATRVYIMAVISLLVGLAIGYVLRGSQPPVSPAQPAASAGASSALGGTNSAGNLPSQSGMRMMAGEQGQPGANSGALSASGGGVGGGNMPTLQELQRMADKQVAPLLEKLKSDPNNSAALIQVGAVYHTSHRFKEAAVYYGKAVQIDPKNVVLRTKLASSIYRAGDADGAIAELNKALSYDPKDANSLFDLGLIRLQAKGDGKGALAAWQQLLKSNPQLSAERKATVQKLMANAQTALGDQHKIQGARQ